MTHLRPGGLPDCHDPWGPATEQDKECADPQEWEAAYSPLPSPTQQVVQPLSSHEITMAVETAWEAAEQEILDGEPPRYGEHVATLIQHACAEKWGVQLGDTGTTKEKA